MMFVIANRATMVVNASRADTAIHVNVQIFLLDLAVKHVNQKISREFFKNKCILFVLDSNPCQNNPCQNGAACTVASNGVHFYCECKPGYTGSFCSKCIQKNFFFYS